jgi:uncharacterized protein (DUF3820 family)
MNYPVKEYTDSTPLPFGRHKGKAMQEVPAEYLVWCLENIPNLDVGIKDYINANMQGIRQEMARHKKH